MTKTTVRGGQLPTHLVFAFSVIMFFWPVESIACQDGRAVYRPNPAQDGQIMEIFLEVFPLRNATLEELNAVPMQFSEGYIFSRLSAAPQNEELFLIYPETLIFKVTDGDKNNLYYSQLSPYGSSLPPYQVVYFDGLSNNFFDDALFRIVGIWASESAVTPSGVSYEGPEILSINGADKKIYPNYFIFTETYNLTALLYLQRALSLDTEISPDSAEMFYHSLLRSDGVWNYSHCNN